MFKIETCLRCTLIWTETYTSDVNYFIIISPGDLSNLRKSIPRNLQ